MKKKPTHATVAATLRDPAVPEPRDHPLQPVPGPMMAELYRRAAVQLRDQQKRKPSKHDGQGAGPDRLLHELEVHQIELEMQNHELQKARDELERALEKYTDLYDFAPMGYFSLGEAGEILEANLTSAALLGVDRFRLINQRLQHFMSPGSRPEFLAFLEKVFSGSGVQSCELRLLKGGDGAFWAGFRATPVLAPRGTRKWCRVAVSDIAARRQADDLLRRNEALFFALIEQAPVGVYVVDEQLRLQQINPRARPIFGKIHPLKGRAFSEIIQLIWPARIAMEILGRFRKTLKTGQPYYSPEFSELRRDTGVMESYEWQIQRITLPAGHHGVVCFFSDITERKRAEGVQRRLEILAASNRKLESEIVRRQAVEQVLKQSEQHQIELLEQSRQLSRQVLRAQEEERKRISRELHDVIAQTLTGINIRLATLKQAARHNPEGLDRQIARTQRLVEHSVSIVHEFARQLRPAVLDDLGLVPALQTYMKGFKQETGIQVTLSASPAVKQIHGEQRTALYRVAQEALINVARHAKASRVEVSIQKLDSAVCLKIKDNGKGFRAQRLVQVKVHKHLGLMGMKERVEMVGGSFAVETAPGKGTTIVAHLPPGKDLRGGGAESAEATT